MSKNTLACNLNSYGKYRGDAYPHLQSIGVRHVEIPAPAPEDVEAELAALARCELSCTSMAVPCDASCDEGVSAFAERVAVLPKFGARLAFVSTKAGDAPPQDCYRRLREMGEAAAPHDVTLVIETHEPFGHNAGIALATMAAVNHPHVRLNFDTGNIYYYNEGVDGTDQLRQMVEYVAAVHLKDTSGGYHEWNFPPLGQGIVDFPAQIGLLNERGFHGPFAMELEGVRGQEMTQEQQFQMVADSVAYLRSTGLFD